MTTDQLSTTFAALADPTRRAILARLAEGEATVNELAEPFPISAAGDLQAPEGAGARPAGSCAAAARSYDRRDCRAEALKEVADWVAEYRGFWEERFDRLDEKLLCASRTRLMKAKAREMTITRVFDASRERVWQAWTEPNGSRLVGQARLEHAAVLDHAGRAARRRVPPELISDEDGRERPLDSGVPRGGGALSGWTRRRPPSRSPTSAAAGPR